MKTTILVCVGLASAILHGSAVPLTESTYTEIIKSVSTLKPDSSAATAAVNEVVKAPARVRTGPESRAELTAGDKTITRVGANTVFSFESAGRVMNLESGSLLFHAPKGAGGGTIKSGGASAAVLGTTIMVSATPGGGFKVIVLEGTGKVILPNGKSVELKGGQMVYVLPDGTFSGVLDINLEKLVSGSSLVNGFTTKLTSLGLIEITIENQKKQLAKGKMEDTGVSADDFIRKDEIPNGLGALDSTTYSTFTLPRFGGGQGLGKAGDSSGNVVTPIGSTTIGGSVNSTVTVLSGH